MQDKYGGAVIMAGVRLHVCQVIRPRMGQSRLLKSDFVMVQRNPDISLSQCSSVHSGGVCHEYPDRRIRGWAWIMIIFRHRGSRCVLGSCLHPPSWAVTSARDRVKTNSWCQISCANWPHYSAIITLACADLWSRDVIIIPARGHGAQWHRRVWHQHCRLCRWLKCITENGSNGIF